jgi:hypothetical protein
MATTKNLVIDQGTTFSANIQYQDTNKTPISLVGYTARSQLRRSYYSANAITFTANIVNSTTGNITISLTSGQTANLVAGRYIYDIEANISDTIVRIVEGIVTVTPGVTR